MTTITQLREITDIIRNLPNKKEKLDYLNNQPKKILNFLSGNIKKDGIAKGIASKIPISKSNESVADIEQIINIFKNASTYPRKKDKIRLMRDIWLTSNDRDLVLTCLYGSLKLGLKIPMPEPEFGEVLRPQLCGTDIEFDPKKYIIEEKFDGIRCIATNNNGEIILQSRNGKILDIPIIEKSLDNAIAPGTTIDGEIIASDGQFQSLDRKSNNLIYMVFDVIFTEGIKVQMPLYHRLTILDYEIYENEHIKISPILSLNRMCEIDDWINSYNVEGIVAKNPNSLYQYGNRKDWIKYKLFNQCSAKVIGFTRGTGKRDRDDMFGAIKIIPENSNIISKCGSGFTDKDLIYIKQLIDEDKNIIVNIKYQNKTNDGSLRFPIFLQIRSIDSKESLEW